MVSTGSGVTDGPADRRDANCSRHGRLADSIDRRPRPRGPTAEYGRPTGPSVIAVGRRSSAGDHTPRNAWRREGREPARASTRPCPGHPSRPQFFSPRGRASIQRVARLCDRCEVRPAVSNRHRYCATCQVEALNVRVARRSRRNMTDVELAAARGREKRRQRVRPGHSSVYGALHQALRRVVRPTVEAGQAVCWRCRRPIVPGQAWDLGHVDGDPSRYAGPEHASAADCPMGGNRATARRDRRRAA